MTSYTKNDFESMQQEAIRRVREMQRRSQSYVNNRNENVKEVKTPTPEPNENKNENSTQNFNQNLNEQEFKHEQNSEDNKSNQQYGQNNNFNRHNYSAKKQKAQNPFSDLLGKAFKGMSGKEDKNGDDYNFQSGLGELFKDFKLDEEKILLGILIYILYKNGSDIKLLLALGYLIL